jgi:hypothetical protein
MPELAFMRLQARSIAIHFRPDSIDTILIIANGPNSPLCIQELHRVVIPEYGSLKHKVRIVDGELLATGLTFMHGWRSQQALKLLAHRLVQAGAYLVLDAKNHFIRDTNVGDFIADDGRMKSYYCNNRLSLRERFEKSFLYFDIDPEKFLDKSLPQVTPFPLRTETVSAMLEFIESSEGVGFDRFFMHPENQVTEFFLVAAYTIRRDGHLEGEYEFTETTRSLSVTLFENRVTNDAWFADSIEIANSAQCKVFALHHAALPKMSQSQRNQVIEIWSHARILEVSDDLVALALRT